MLEVPLVRNERSGGNIPQRTRLPVSALGNAISHSPMEATNIVIGAGSIYDKTVRDEEFLQIFALSQAAKLPSVHSDHQLTPHIITVVQKHAQTSRSASNQASYRVKYSVPLEQHALVFYKAFCGELSIL
jgi:hypothetical protein